MSKIARLYTVPNIELVLDIPIINLYTKIQFRKIELKLLKLLNYRPTDRQTDTSKSICSPLFEGSIHIMYYGCMKIPREISKTLSESQFDASGALCHSKRIEQSALHKKAVKDLKVRHVLQTVCPSKLHVPVHLKLGDNCSATL